MTGGYEALVGWRYLLRQRPRPRLLLTGLIILAVGAVALGVGLWLQQNSGQSVSVFGSGPNVARALMGAGAGIAVVGGCISLFGALYTFMTVFSAFSTFMVTIGVAEVILVLGVMNGFQGDLRKKIIDTYSHIVIEPAQQNTWIENYLAITKQVKSTSGVLGASPVLKTEVMLNAPTNLAASALVGIVADNIGETNKLPTQLLHGCLDRLNDATAECLHWLEYESKALNAPSDAGETNRAPDRRQPNMNVGHADESELGLMAFPKPASAKKTYPPTIIVGKELRRNLVLWPDEMINVISPFGDLGPEGPMPKSRPFVLGGWFESGMLEFDTKLAYAGIESVQRFMGLGDVASAIQVKVARLEDARGVRDVLRTQLPKNLRITDWQDRNRNLFSALELEKIAMFLVLTINILLAAFSITSTLVMTIIERKREIAIMMAMGANARSILRIFLSQGAFTGAVGSAIGTLIGVSLGFALANINLPINQDVYYISAIPVDLRIFDVVAIIAVAIFVSLASTIYPARFAARLKPVEGLNA